MPSFKGRLHATLTIPDLGFAVWIRLVWHGEDEDHREADETLLQSVIDITILIYEGEKGKRRKAATSTGGGANAAAKTEKDPSATLTSTSEPKMASKDGLFRALMFEDPHGRAWSTGAVEIVEHACMSVPPWPWKKAASARSKKEPEPPDGSYPDGEDDNRDRFVLPIPYMKLETASSAAVLPPINYLRLKPAPVVHFEIRFADKKWKEAVRKANNAAWTSFASYALELYLVDEPSYCRTDKDAFDRWLVDGTLEADKLKTISPIEAPILSVDDAKVSVSLDNELEEYDYDPCARQMVFARLVRIDKPEEKLGRLRDKPDELHEAPIARGCARWAIFAAQPKKPQTMGYREGLVLIPNGEDPPPLPGD